MTDNECAAAVGLIQKSLIGRLLTEGRVTPRRASQLERSELPETIRECLRFTDRVVVPFPGAGAALTFTAEGVA